MPIFRTYLLISCFAAAAVAQGTLSLPQAIQTGLQRNETIHASAAGVQAAEAGVREAKAGFLPKLNYTESAIRSNNPVFVFGSLLTQHQFAQNNFQIGALNNPGFLDDFQSSVTAEQTVFDAGRTAKAVQAARLRKEMSEEESSASHNQVLLGIVRAYFDAVLSQEALAAAQDAVKSADADLSQAEKVRETGLSTDADVLSIRVHAAAVRQQEIRRSADVSIAQATLNDALGLPLDTAHTLTTALEPAKLAIPKLQELDHLALSRRPEQRQAEYSAQIASTQLSAARYSFLPTVGVRANFEADRQDFIARGGTNWLFAASLTWNIFNGLADKAHVEEATASVLKSQAEARHVRSAVQLQVRRAQADLQAAQQEIAVAQSAVAQAEESLRITRNRYQAGLNTVTDLLRTEAALLDSRTNYLSAVHGQRIAVALLDVATGTLSIDSAAVQE
jgi:outer membrane protein TolC